MKEKIYVNVNNLSDLLTMKNEYGENAYIVAGGTDLVVRMKSNLLNPKVLIGIRNVDELKGIIPKRGFIVIGANTNLDDIENNELIKNEFYPLYRAIYQMASPQIRNMATIGGNLANASPAGDTIPPLYLMDAQIVLYSVKGKRIIPINEFFIGPGKTVIKSNEIIHSIIVKNKHYSEKNSGYIKVGQRNALAISIVSIAYYKGKINFKFAFGSVAPTIKLLSVKKGLTEKEIEKNVLELISPIDDVRASAEYRKAVTLNLIKDLYL